MANKCNVYHYPWKEAFTLILSFLIPLLPRSHILLPQTSGSNERRLHLRRNNDSKSVKTGVDAVPEPEIR